MGFLDEEVQRIERSAAEAASAKKPGKISLGVILIAVAGIIFIIVAAGFLTYSKDRSIAVIPLEGEISTGDFSIDGYAGSEYVGRQLRSAADDPLVEAIVLRVNSPGGSPAGAQEIIADLEYAKARKPVVVSMGDLAASAAYYISAHADRIYASPDTLTGSVGTTWIFIDISEWMKKEGYAVDVVKSGDRKDMTSPYRSRTDAELVYAQDIVNDSFEQFITDVIAQRHVERSAIEDGRIMRGQEALQIGLVDEMGNLYAAIDGAREMAATR
ncbi:MAG: signal peptide peptidase SppA [Methanomicrobiales archaeon]|nr:signal peptide peptidase SppA [Methanomicrobiales archaeon]